MLSPALLKIAHDRKVSPMPSSLEVPSKGYGRRGSAGSLSEEDKMAMAVSSRRPSLLLSDYQDFPPPASKERRSSSSSDKKIKIENLMSLSPLAQRRASDKMFSKTSNLMGTASIFRDQQAAKEAEKQRMMMRRASQQRRESIVPGPKANVSTHQYTQDPTLAWEMLREKRPVRPVRQMKLDTPVKMDHVRFVCIGCTHGSRLDPATIPPGDILLIAGDFTSCGLPKEVQAFNKNLGHLKHAYKVVIAGNHECTFDHNFLSSSIRETEAKELALKQALISALQSSKLASPKPLITNAIYLEDSVIELFGITIYGSPWQPKVDNWAFNLPRGQQLLDKWNQIPAGVDVLLTHTPPLGHGDLMATGQRMGCVELLNSVTKRIKPKYHVFSHIHEGYGCTSDGYTKFINCAQCDEQLEWKNEPVIFDIPVHPHTKTFYLQNVKKIMKRFLKDNEKK